MQSQTDAGLLEEGAQEEFHDTSRPLRVFRLSKVIFISPFTVGGVSLLAAAYAQALTQPWRLFAPSTWTLIYCGCVAAGALAVLLVFIRWQTTQFIIYPDRVVARSGFVRRYAQSASLREVIGAELNQSIDGRMMGYGDIALDTSGVVNIRMKSLGNAREAVNLVMHLRGVLDSRREAPSRYRKTFGS
ncbi:PH domain-containing protein [Microvirga calopogonii]|uniref:PH domain-containing protein n=1 Tax=Microvirga calopogonii TaxID=2078013 RepID=UPI0013B381F6|nr:PH domain-containing protein [Microvirga calopogonii]